MSSILLSLLLEVLGLIALSAGLIGGIATMFKELEEKKRGIGFEALPTTFIEALTKLLEVLIRAPTWFALVIIGVVLIVGSNFVKLM